MVFSNFFYFFENKRNCLFFLKIYGFLSRFITFFSRLSFYNNIGKGKSPPSFLLLAVRQSFSRRLTPFWSEFFPESPIQSEEVEPCIPTRQQRFVDEMIKSPNLIVIWFWYTVSSFTFSYLVLYHTIFQFSFTNSQPNDFGTTPFHPQNAFRTDSFLCPFFFMGRKNSDRNFPPVAVFFFILWFSFDCLLADSPYGYPFRSFDTGHPVRPA